MPLDGTEFETEITTQQHAFDKAVLGVIQQGKPGFDDSIGNCVFLSPDGNRCAIGHLLPLEALLEIDSRTGGNGVEVFADIRPLLPDFLLSPDGKGLSVFANDLQGAHDEAATLEQNDHEFVAAFRRLAREIAERHGLSTAILD